MCLPEGFQAMPCCQELLHLGSDMLQLLKAGLRLQYLCHCCRPIAKHFRPTCPGVSWGSLRLQLSWRGGKDG